MMRTFDIKKSLIHNLSVISLTLLSLIILWRVIYHFPSLYIDEPQPNKLTILTTHAFVLEHDLRQLKKRFEQENNCIIETINCPNASELFSLIVNSKLPKIVDVIWGINSTHLTQLDNKLIWNGTLLSPHNQSLSKLAFSPVRPLLEHPEFNIFLYPINYNLGIFVYKNSLNFNDEQSITLEKLLNNPHTRIIMPQGDMSTSGLLLVNWLFALDRLQQYQQASTFFHFDPAAVNEDNEISDHKKKASYNLLDSLAQRIVIQTTSFEQAFGLFCLNNNINTFFTYISSLMDSTFQKKIKNKEYKILSQNSLGYPGYIDSAAITVASKQKELATKFLKFLSSSIVQLALPIHENLPLWLHEEHDPLIQEEIFANTLELQKIFIPLNSLLPNPLTADSQPTNLVQTADDELIHNSKKEPANKEDTDKEEVCEQMSTKLQDDYRGRDDQNEDMKTQSFLTSTLADPQVDLLENELDDSQYENKSNQLLDLNHDNTHKVSLSRLDREINHSLNNHSVKADQQFVESPKSDQYSQSETTSNSDTTISTQKKEETLNIEEVKHIIAKNEEYDLYDTLSQILAQIPTIEDKPINIEKPDKQEDGLDKIEKELTTISQPTPHNNKLDHLVKEYINQINELDFTMGGRDSGAIAYVPPVVFRLLHNHVVENLAEILAKTSLLDKERVQNSQTNKPTDPSISVYSVKCNLFFIRITNAEMVRSLWEGILSKYKKN